MRRPKCIRCGEPAWAKRVVDSETAEAIEGPMCLRCFMDAWHEKLYGRAE